MLSKTQACGRYHYQNDALILNTPLNLFITDTTVAIARIKYNFLFVKGKVVVRKECERFYLLRALKMHEIPGH